MNILEKIQDILYDIFGMLIPGVTALFFVFFYCKVFSLTGSMEETFLDFPIYIKKVIGAVAEMNLNNNIAIGFGLIGSYLLGCGLFVIGKAYTRELRDSKNYRKCSRDCSLLLDKYFDGKVDKSVYKENSMVFIRQLVSKEENTTMISKYIAKHNFFFSMEPIMMIMNVIYLAVGIKEFWLKDYAEIYSVMMSIALSLFIIVLSIELKKSSFRALIFIIVNLLFMVFNTKYIVGLIYSVACLGCVSEGDRHLTLSNKEHIFEMNYKIIQKINNDD